MSKVSSLLIRIVLDVPLFIGRWILISVAFDILCRKLHWQDVINTSKLKGLVFTLFIALSYIAIRLKIKLKFFNEDGFYVHIEREAALPL
jgi:hypothetical protein